MIKNDRWIRQMAQQHALIKPFEEKQVGQGVISYGLSSYGYDIRVAEDFKIFTNVNSTIVGKYLEIFVHLDPCQRKRLH